MPLSNAIIGGMPVEEQHRDRLRELAKKIGVPMPATYDDGENVPCDGCTMLINCWTTQRGAEACLS